MYIIYFWLCWVFAVRVFSRCGEQRLPSNCSARASHRGGFSCCRGRALGCTGPAFVALELSCSAAGGIAQIRDVPDQVSPALQADS